MPIPLTALLASAIHEVRVAGADPLAMQRITELLAHAAGAGFVTWEVDTAGLLANGVPIPAGAPGATVVRAVLRQQGVKRITLPPKVSAEGWGQLAELLASAPGLYPDATQFIHAVQSVLPAAELIPAPPDDIGPELREALSAIPIHVEEPVLPAPAEPRLVSTGTDRASLSTALDPLLDKGAAAVRVFDWATVAEVLLGLQELEGTADDATRAIIATERRRIVSPDTLRRLVRMLPGFGAGSPVTRAITGLGRDGVDALLDVLAEKPARHEHRAYFEALMAARDAEPMLLASLDHPSADVLSDVIAVLGRRRVERAVPRLIGLLKDEREKVRTAAWHALEQIGTPEAVAALR